MHEIIKVLLAFAVTMVLAGCASTRAPDPRDPWEPLNRATFEFNDALDRTVFKPVAEGYRAVLPSPVRTGVRNFFSNLNDPWIAVNQLLQGKVDDAFSDVWRFITNSTFGMAGLFDIASDMQMPKHNEDFGQTLAVWRLGFGPYFVLPILGPSTVRDAGGRAVDSFAYLPAQGPDWLDFNHRVTWRTSLTALDFIQIRAGLLDATTALEEAALDRYAFVRNAYFQRRRNLVYDGKPPPEDTSEKQSQSLDAEVQGTRNRDHDLVSVAGELSVLTSGAAGSPPSVEPRVPVNYWAVLEAGTRRVAPNTK